MFARLTSIWTHSGRHLGTCVDNSCEPVVCLPDGDDCSFGDQCCSGVCVDGTCGSDCQPLEGYCSSNADCCTGFCNVDTAVYKSLPEAVPRSVARAARRTVTAVRAPASTTSAPSFRAEPAATANGILMNNAPALRTLCLRLSLTGLLGLASGLTITACAPESDGEGEFVCDGSSCQCPGTGDCRLDCTNACVLDCTGSGDCDFACDAGCMTTCPGSGMCSVDVGDDSTVVCSGSGGCDVVCQADCTIECPGSGACLVECLDPEATCQITRCEEVVDCGDGFLVCNGSCP